MDGDAATEAALSVDATRFRLALEGTNERTLASGAAVSPSLELGVRYGGGDGDSGTGLELGGDVRYTNAATGLSVAGKARVLLGRDDWLSHQRLIASLENDSATKHCPAHA